MAAVSNNLDEILKPFYQRASEAEVRIRHTKSSIKLLIVDVIVNTSISNLDDYVSVCIVSSCHSFKPQKMDNFTTCHYIVMYSARFGVTAVDCESDLSLN